MKLAKFSTLEAANTVLDRFNLLAKYPESNDPFYLTTINQSSDGSFYWFNFDGCVNNGGLGKSEIEAAESELNIFEFDAIPSDWISNTETE
ncbi:MAG: hypothetical protein EBS06_05490 [Proteobacteria bacterium]|nr:hypothetical protein [Pseudomonadota bacterium]